MSDLTSEAATRILVLGSVDEPHFVDGLGDDLSVEVTTASDVLSDLNDSPKAPGADASIGVIVLLDVDQAPATLDWVDASEHLMASFPRACFLVLGASDSTPFQGLLEEDRLFYLSQQRPDIAATEALARSALRQAAEDDAASNPTDSMAADSQAAAQTELLRRLAQSSEPMRVVLSSLHEILPLHTAGLWRVDGQREVLYRLATSGGEDTASEQEHGACAVTGLLGFVARTGCAVACDRAMDDGRFDAQIDPLPDPRGRLLVLPIVDPGEEPRSWRWPLGLLALERRAEDPAWKASEQRQLTGMLRRVVPFLLPQLQTPAEEPSSGPFRRAALEHHGAACLETVGPVLEITPFWLRHVHRGLGVAMVLAVLALGLIQIDDYASGTAVLRAQQSAEVVSPQSGVVAQVTVRPGQSVEQNQPLLRLHDDASVTALRRVQEQLRSGLARRLLDPTTPSTSELATLRSQWRELQRRRDETVIRAPRRGVVQEVRLRAGDAVTAGDIALTLDRQGQELSVVALLPGSYRPSLQPGQELRLELQGFHSTYHELHIEAVGEDVVGPSAVRRQLGADLRDSVALQGPMVWVEARLRQQGFQHQGVQYRYHDGMAGTASVRLRRRSLLRAMLPFSETLEAGHG